MTEASQGHWRVCFNQLPAGWFEVPLKTGRGAVLRPLSPFHRVAVEMTKAGFILGRSQRPTEAYLDRVAPDGQVTIGGAVKAITRKDPVLVETSSLQAFAPGRDEGQDLAELAGADLAGGVRIGEPASLDLPAGPAVRVVAESALSGSIDLRYWLRVQPAISPEEAAGRSYLLGISGKFSTTENRPDDSYLTDMDQVVGGVTLEWKQV